MAGDGREHQSGRGSQRGREPRPDPREPDYAAGLPDHHDPTAGIGGAAPAHSALTLRLVLAVFGVMVCVALALWLGTAGSPVLLVVGLVVLAVVAAVDIVVVVRRKRRGEPG